MKRRIGSIFLSILILCSSVDITVFAKEMDEMDSAVMSEEEVGEKDEDNTS